ncbi:MAG: hypothetical protein E7328_05635 [Clostridiales bacterium]|nr:hypothetical protein [Clostridiales bacterium]
MRKKQFKTSLFGYNKREVDAYMIINEAERNRRTAADERLENLAKENVNLAVELKIARSGFVDATELMMAAGERARELEAELNEAKIKLEDLSTQLMDALAAQPKDGETAELMELLSKQIEALGSENLDTLRAVLSDAELLKRAAEGEEDVTEDTAFQFPDGFHHELNTPVSSARGLMHKIYELRRQGAEE